MNYRSNLIGGMILILIGILFLFRSYIPMLFEMSWPLYILGVGLVFLIAAILSGVGGLAIPACIVGGIGGILYYQNISGNWESWAYLWTLIPGFVGLGILIAALFSPGSHIDPSGWFMILLSLVGFIIFGGILGHVAFWGVDITKYWPALLVVIGIFILMRPFIRVKP